MSDAHIQAKIREYLSRHTLDSHLGRLSSSSEYLHLINEQLPHLTPTQIRSICKAQEQNVFLYQFRSFKKCCPSVAMTSTLKSLRFVPVSATSNISRPNRWPPASIFTTRSWSSQSDPLASHSQSSPGSRARVRLSLDRCTSICA